MDYVLAFHRQSFCGLHGRVGHLPLGYAIPKSSTSVAAYPSAKARTTLVVYPGTALDRRQVLPSKTVAAIYPRPAGAKLTYVSTASVTLRSVSAHVAVAQKISLKIKALHGWPVLKLNATSRAIVGYLTPHCAISDDYDFAPQDGRVSYCLNKALDLIETYETLLSLLRLLGLTTLHVSVGVVVTIITLVVFPFVLLKSAANEIVSPGSAILCLSNEVSGSTVDASP